MTITIDYGNTNIIFVPQADLTLVSGTLYELDVDAFRLILKDIEDDEIGAVFTRTHNHNTEVTVAGTTFARTVEILNPYSVEFEDGAYSVRLFGANNNIFDIQNGILVQNQVQVIPSNSAGLQTVVSGSGVTPQDKIDIANEVFNFTVEDAETFVQMMRLIRAEAAGTITRSGDVHRVKSVDGLVDRIVANADENGRTVTATDGS